ncbi:hypothetical protein EGP98_01870 [bacterium]|nr:hypothetical protein [bacterium]
MSPVSLNEKLKIIWSVISSSPLYLIFFVAIALLVYLFSTTSSFNKKQSRKTYILVYSAFFIYLAIQYGGSLSTLIDYAVNQVFIGYYFPNIVIYILILLIATIITLVTIFRKNTTRILKILNSVVYGFLVYFLILILSVVNNLKIDVFDLKQLYSSNKVRSLLEISMFLFVIWVLVLIVYRFICKYQEKKREASKEEFTNYNVIHNFEDNKVLSPRKSYTYFEEPVVKQPEVVKEKKEEPFTLDEYKLMLKVLKEEKQKEQQQNNSLSELNYLYQRMGE